MRLGAAILIAVATLAGCTMNSIVVNGNNNVVQQFASSEPAAIEPRPRAPDPERNPSPSAEPAPTPSEGSGPVDVQVAVYAPCAGADEEDGDVRIFLDSQQIGKHARTTLGSHEIRAEASGCSSESRSVRLSEGKPNSIAIKLAPTLGSQLKHFGGPVAGNGPTMRFYAFGGPAFAPANTEFGHNAKNVQFRTIFAESAQMNGGGIGFDASFSKWVLFGGDIGYWGGGQAPLSTNSVIQPSAAAGAPQRPPPGSTVTLSDFATRFRLGLTLPLAYVAFDAGVFGGLEFLSLSSSFDLGDNSADGHGFSYGYWGQIRIQPFCSIGLRARGTAAMTATLASGSPAAPTIGFFDLALYWQSDGTFCENNGISHEKR